MTSSDLLSIVFIWFGLGVAIGFFLYINSFTDNMLAPLIVGCMFGLGSGLINFLASTYESKQIAISIR